MLLQGVFPADRIKIGLESEDKADVFEELCDILVAGSRKPLDRTLLLRALQERESKMSTGIKPGIALPHGKTPAVDSTCGVLGVSRKGIAYDSIDGKPVRLIFMIISSPEKLEEHLKVLKRLAVLLDDPRFTDELLRAPGPQEAFAVLAAHESGMARDA